MTRDEQSVEEIGNLVTQISERDEQERLDAAREAVVRAIRRAQEQQERREALEELSNNLASFFRAAWNTVRAMDSGDWLSLFLMIALAAVVILVAVALTSAPKQAAKEAGPAIVDGTWAEGWDCIPYRLKADKNSQYGTNSKGWLFCSTDEGLRCVVNIYDDIMQCDWPARTTQDDSPEYPKVWLPNAVGH